MLSPAVENLVAQLTRLPGVGTRTAQRLAFHLMRTQKEEALQLAQAIEVVKERVRFCRECGNWTEDEVCTICADARRDHSVICVVEQPVGSDLEYADEVTLGRAFSGRREMA